MKLKDTTSSDLQTTILTSTSYPVGFTSPETEVIVVQDLSNDLSETNVDRVDWIFIAIIILVFLLIVAVVCR